tara:strand:+ start:2703 stop:2978 length:276 start_codon:yes stop_codon:yes gene_type:complete
LEVFDLETAHFVQYKPDGGEFDPPILEVVEVKRDRMWFEKSLPIFQSFMTDLEQFKHTAMDSAPHELITPIPRPVKRKIPDEFLILNNDEN